MNLYRLDYRNGCAEWPVRNSVGMTYLGRLYRPTVDSAAAAARSQGCDVIVTRISRAGSLTAVLCVHADGTRERVTD